MKRLLAGTGTADDILFGLAWAHTQLGCDYWDNRWIGADGGFNKPDKLITLTAEERADVEAHLAYQEAH